MVGRSALCALALVWSGCSGETFEPSLERPSWCEDLPREVYASLSQVPITDDWFEVYEVDRNVFAIYEPHQFQEVISYLIVGERRALLWDSGMGIGRISEVVDELTDVPVVVVNSHTHPDHVGGNAEFAEIWGFDTDFSNRSASGYANARMVGQVRPGALCRALPEGVDSSNYEIKPFRVGRRIQDGSTIALGGRDLQILAVPGHTPDAAALLDTEAGLLFTGDSFYEGPIYLFSPETDLAQFQASIERLARLVPNLSLLLPGHNTAIADPVLLLRLEEAVDEILAGSGAPTESGNRLEYQYDGFSILVSANAVR